MVSASWFLIPSSSSVGTSGNAGERVAAYRYDGLWLDIGRHEDYEQAISADPDLVTVLKEAAARNQLAAAGKAIEIDPNLAEAHAARCCAGRA